MAHCSRSPLRPSVRTRYRSAIPAPRRQFRKIPDWRQRKCTGDTTAIIAIIACIITTAAITIIITIVTGTAGERGRLAHERVRFAAGLFSSWPLPRNKRDCCAQLDRMEQESAMKRLIASAFVAGALVFAGSAAINPAAAAPQAKTQNAGASDATDFSAHRHHRRYHRHYGHYRPHYRPYYYGRPVYYRPYPYSAPAPFTFGIGFGPSWW